MTRNGPIEKPQTKAAPKDSPKAARRSTRSRSLHLIVTHKIKTEKLNMKRRLMKNMLMPKNIFLRPRTYRLEKKLIKLLLLTTNQSLC